MSMVECETEREIILLTVGGGDGLPGGGDYICRSRVLAGVDRQMTKK